MSVLMDIIVDAENFLGYEPPLTGGPAWKIRAAEHRKLTRALESRRYTEADLQLAYNYCRRRRHPIKRLIELVDLIPVAKDLAAAPDTLIDVAQDTADAVTWEAERGDELSTYWIGRLVRAEGPVRAEVVQEWRESGRGPQ
jgi:hypothetical protein